ncbi:MAG: hypothetical protein A3J38_04175 [Gammaproteobacteria bacterium RIFCSPHIGHO2_12_FULL_45_9]|nr:MAG: hypothetical protein A3J38_04175 [Gammaproteobacteria bacterium RIFCSPHIGHO2_12_FULL_45_9]
MKHCLTWLLPYTCILCHQSSQRQQDLCTACLNELPILLHPCQKCALPLPINLDLACGQCQQQPPYSKIFALFAYQAPITQLILQLKFHHQLVYARILGELLAAKIAQTWYQTTALPTVIIPVPLHSTRLQERGFNQAVEIARSLAKILLLPIDRYSCSRIKSTSPQMTLSADKRRQNMQQAFHVSSDFTGITVAIVDDVVTTGSTVAELSRAIKARGAKEVHIWCCARAG